MDDPVVFVDTETTSLNRITGEAWNIALITPVGGEFQWYIRPNALYTADADSLRINRYYEHLSHIVWNTPEVAAESIAQVLSGKHIVAAVPDFDAWFLAKILREYNHAPAWHYHLIDIETLIAGKYEIHPPYDSDELIMRLGIDPNSYERHTALGDARLVRDCYNLVYSTAISPLDNPL